MGADKAERVRRLQERVSAALREMPKMRAGNFSDYLPGPWTDLAKRLTAAASPGGVEGIEAALDEYDRLSAEEDPLVLRRALMIFLTHHPEATRLGLRVPSLKERGPWKVLPSRRK